MVDEPVGASVARLKAEATVAAVSTVRHRAPRFAALVLGAWSVVVASGGAAEIARPLGLDIGTGVLAAFAAVCASRPLARGPALHSVRLAGGTVWSVLAGRAVGVAMLVIAGWLTVATGEVIGRHIAWSQAGPLGLPACGVSVLVLGMAPRVGASAAAWAGVLVGVAWAVWLWHVPVPGLGHVGALAVALGVGAAGARRALGPRHAMR